MRALRIWIRTVAAMVLVLVVAALCPHPADAHPAGRSVRSHPSDGRPRAVADRLYGYAASD